MIHSFHIKNFQSWKEAHFDFHPGVNLIVGTSDSGKSAVLRGLRWLIENRPTGNAFRSWWAGKKDSTIAMVQLDDEDGTLITRSRDASSNVYGIDGEITHDAVRSEVPEDINKLLNFSPIGFQWQHDKPFLLSDTSGEVARQLNRVAGLEDIDRSLSNIESMSRRNRSDLRAAEANREQAEEDVKPFEWVAAADKALTSIEKLDSEAEEVEVDLADIESLIESIEDAEGRRDKLTEGYDLEKAQEELEELGELVQGEEDAREELADLSNLIKRIEAGQASHTAAGKEVLDLEKKLKAQTPDICPLCGK
jgi:DNA repair protein SbcC/Rad50